jgi:hypothetical protein
MSQPACPVPSRCQRSLPSGNRPRWLARSRWLALVLGLVLATQARGSDERNSSPIEVYEWSVWVGSPSQTTLNGPRVYRNAMPGSVGTSRPKFEEAELARKFAIAPISVVQVFGEPTKDVDVDLRVKKGTLLAHWPQGTERTGRLQWFKSNLLAAPPAGIVAGYVPENHWLQRLRRDGPLYLKHETRIERFLAYDTELMIPIPVKIRGGPDEYTLQNLTGQRLVDVAVIAPVEGGYRVAWLDALPTAVPPEKPVDDFAKARETEKKKQEKEQPQAKAKAATAVFEAAEAESKPAKDKDKDKPKAEAKPLPAEGDADIRARVDQVLNRPVTVNVEGAPRKEVLALVAGQARLRYEVDDPTLAKADVDLSRPMSLKAGQLAARDALADILGTVGLSYRVTEDGTLFITTAARLAEDSGKKGAVIEGPPVKLTLSKVMRPTDAAYREITHDAYTRRLIGQGMRTEVVQTYLDQYGKDLFEPGGLIVLAHLSRDAIDEVVLLDVFPPPKKFVRMAAVVAHGVDPRLQDRARTLVKQLGDSAHKAREVAEAQLFEMGPVAVPALEDALRDKDVEIVFRSERLLMRLNRPVP